MTTHLVGEPTLGGGASGRGAIVLLVVAALAGIAFGAALRAWHDTRRKK